VGGRVSGAAQGRVQWGESQCGATRAGLVKRVGGGEARRPFTVTEQGLHCARDGLSSSDPGRYALWHDGLFHGDPARVALGHIAESVGCPHGLGQDHKGRIVGFDFGLDSGLQRGRSSSEQEDNGYPPRQVTALHRPHCGTTAGL